jgi:glycosyltransferase involved in cell wall biosynthesis
MVACFKPQKSPVDFIDVAAEVVAANPTVHFVIAGDGELRPAVEARIRERGVSDHVTLLGWQQDMPEVYRNLDVFVLTSLWEGQPCVFAEAMASGLPIVATQADGATEAITEGVTGFVCPLRDITRLADRVLRLVGDPELRRTMGKAGRERVGEFDIDLSVARLEAEYRRSASGSRPPLALGQTP